MVPYIPNTKRSLKRLAMLLLATSLLAAPLKGYETTTSEALLSSWEANPDNDSHIPNFAYAGYRNGLHPVPTPPVVANVRDFGAVGDGSGDDSPAFLAALEHANSLGGGTVFVPAGNYRLEDAIRMKYDGVVLRGEDKFRTLLYFPNSTQTTTSHGANGWFGGLIWFAPPSSWNSQGQIIDTNGLVRDFKPSKPFSDYARYDQWQPGSLITMAAGEVPKGSETITVADASTLSADQWIFLRYRKTDGFFADIAGALDASATPAATTDQDYTGKAFTAKTGWIWWEWPVQIKEISGNQVTLHQPLRVRIHPVFDVALLEIGEVVQESGIENFTINFGHDTLFHYHNNNEGWQGLCFTRSINCWARDLLINTPENGVLISAAKNLHISEIAIRGNHYNHHAVDIRMSSQDNLVQHVSLDGPETYIGSTIHGFDLEQLSSGNVYRASYLSRGFFDFHGGAAFDNLYTDITIGSVGGSTGGFGPFAAGRNNTLWNIRADRPDSIYELGWPIGPRRMVGIQISGPNKGPVDSMGRSGSPFPATIADDQSVPAVEDLYLYQLQEHLQNTTPELTWLSVTGSGEELMPGQSMSFSAQGLDQKRFPLATQPSISWSATGGTITNDGVYTANPDSFGPQTITATAELNGRTVRGRTFVTINNGLHVNFQLSSLSAFAPFKAEHGEAFGPRSEGGEYGFVGAISTEGRRVPDSLEGILHATSMSMRHVPEYIWEAAVPNGWYRVTLGGGHERWFRWMEYQVEGIEVLRGHSTTENPYLEGSAVVEVSDGRLTVTINTESFLNFVQAFPLPQVSPVLRMELIAGQPHFTFPTQVGKTYRLMENINLDPAGWTEIPGTSLTGTGAPATLDLPDLPPPGEKRFYRLVIE